MVWKMTGKGRTRGREAYWEVVAITQVRHAADLDQGGGSGDKWRIQEVSRRWDPLNFLMLFSQQDLSVYYYLIKTLPVFRLKCKLFHKIFLVLPESLSAFPNVHSNLYTSIVSLDFRMELLLMSQFSFKTFESQDCLTHFSLCSAPCVCCRGTGSVLIRSNCIPCALYALDCVVCACSAEILQL